MYSSRNIMRSPHVCRVIKSPPVARNASFLAPAAFQRFPNGPLGFSNELAPLFRLMDDIASPRAFDFSPLNHQSQPRQTWQPRFDVRENEGSYELRGELPGVESKDLEVEFTDEQTLVIRGRTTRESSSGDTEMSGALQQSEEPKQQDVTQATLDNSDAVSEKSNSSYVRPTVEDEATGEISSAGEPTPAETPTTEQAQATDAPTEQQQQNKEKQSQKNSRYWISERSVGSFQRVFNFQGRVDQDGVTASLKNGILSVAVPKAATPNARRINVE